MSPEATAISAARNAAAPDPQAASIFTASCFHSPIQSEKNAPSWFCPLINGRKHVADEKRIHLFHACILHGGKSGIAPDLAQGFFPMLIDFCLTNSEDGYFSHVPQVILTELSIIFYQKKERLNCRSIFDPAS